MRARRIADREPGRLFAAAARPLLEPLACRQKGLSRVFIADERYWLLIVELRPASLGALELAVGTHWLWYPQSRWCFDYGYKAGTAEPYRDAAQFTPVAEGLARRAAAEAAAVRAKFASVADIARHHAAAANDGWWPLYHRAVASGLAGDIEAAGQCFRRLGEKPATRDWETQLQSDAGGLAPLAGDRVAFRGAITTIVNRARALQGLPADPDCLDRS
jgi:hypothetical protein